MPRLHVAEDQVTTESGIAFCIPQCFSYMFLTPCILVPAYYAGIILQCNMCFETLGIMLVGRFFHIVNCCLGKNASHDLWEKINQHN